MVPAPTNTMGGSSKKVVIYAGRRRSLSSMLLLWALEKKVSTVKVVGVVCPSEFNIKRIRGWYGRLGSKFFRKIFSELGWFDSKFSNSNEEHGVLRELALEWNFKASSLSNLCNHLEIPFHIVRDINCSNSVELVKSFQPDLAVYSGAGILRKGIIQAGGQVLNLHCGPLPEIRGMNAVEWSLFHGLDPEVTLHYIDEGIDTGKIISSRRFNVEAGDSISVLRGRSVATGIELLIDSLNNWDAQSVRANPLEEGRQYFSMSETLRLQLQAWIDQGKTPT